MRGIRRTAPAHVTMTIDDTSPCNNNRYSIIPLILHQDLVFMRSSAHGGRRRGDRGPHALPDHRRCC
eukprot:SAG22_NODE_33_length_27588_cov_104.174652_11_plen_67_part_00